jgi:hypothetical protein
MKIVNGYGLAAVLCGVLLGTPPAPLWAAEPSAISTGTVGVPSDLASPTRLAAVLARVREARTPQERQEAVRMLRRTPYRGPQAFRTLSAAMTEDLSNEVRQEAAVALLDYEGSETLVGIEAFFKTEMGDDARRTVCVALATAPARGGDRGVTSLLTGLLSGDPAPAVRMAAVAGLLARQDRSALGELRRAAQRDPDKKVREQAQAAYRLLAQPPKTERTRVAKPQRASYDAVRGKDPCPPGNGWCECSQPPLKTKSRCLPREDCEHTYFNTYRSLGFSCAWDGEVIR